MRMLRLSQVAVPRPYKQLIHDLTIKYSATSQEVHSLERALGMVVSRLSPFMNILNSKSITAEALEQC